MKIKKQREFANGIVYALETSDEFPLEVTDTFLPFYTKDAIGHKQNNLKNSDLGSRKERYMVGVSCQSGCPVRCKFCATGKLKRFRNLTSEEIVEQVEFVINSNSQNPNESQEFKINYTRCGEPFLNIENVKHAIKIIDTKYENVHHYISTIGIRGSDYSWIKDNITLQLSLHSFDDEKRNKLIPFKNKLSIEELGKIRTESNLKTTLNLTLVDETDFDIEKLKKWFPVEHFFVKLSPINVNEISENNNMGPGIIKSKNLK